MRTLPYSELFTPHTLSVVSTERLPDGGVSARLVDQRAREREIAIITVDADGTVSLSCRDEDRARLKQFAGRCRGRFGERLPREAVWQKVAMEELYEQAVAEAEQADSRVPQVAVRALHRTGTITLHQVEAPGPIGLGPELQIEPDVFTRTVERAEAWMANQWVRVYPLRTDRKPKPIRRTQLPHTGVWVPLAFPAEIELDDSHVHPEGSWEMFVWIAGHPMGRASRSGDYVTFTEHAPGAMKVVDYFTLASLGPEHECFSSKEELLEMLFAEEFTARALRKALSHGDHLLRIHTEQGVELRELPDQGVRGEMDYTQARADALAQLPDYAVKAEMWTEHGWVSLPCAD